MLSSYFCSPYPTVLVWRTLVPQAPAVPGDPRAGKRHSRSRITSSICISRGCPCSGDTPGAEPPSAKRQSFQNSKPESCGTPWLERTGWSMENTLCFMHSLTPPAHSSAQQLGMPSTTTGFCMRFLSASDLMGLQVSTILWWQQYRWQPAWQKEDLPHHQAYYFKWHIQAFRFLSPRPSQFLQLHCITDSGTLPLFHLERCKMK